MMGTLLLTARLLLAAVFTVAGLAKLADRAGSHQALIGFGIPASAARPVALLLPLAELAVAGALIPLGTAWWGAVAALALLLLFVAAIGYNLARGRKPSCHCFGQLYSAPAGWPTLARNTVLALVAAVIVWQGQTTAGASAVAWTRSLSVGQVGGLVFGVALLGIVAAQGWVLLNLLRQNGRLLLRIEVLETKLAASAPAAPAPAPPQAAGLPVGTPAPAFKLPGVYGEVQTLDALRTGGKPVLLVFSDPGCGPCTALFPELARWQNEYTTKLSIASISRGPADANRARSSEHGLTHVLLQEDREVAQAYGVSGTPSAVVILPDGTIGSPLAQGADAIRKLVLQTAAVPSVVPPPAAAPAPPCDCGKQNGNCDCARHNGNGQPAALAQPMVAQIGEPAPPLKLSDLTGKTVDLAEFRGRETLVLFWNPGCGFCSRMLPALKSWEAQPPEGAPQLLVVSTGTVEANEAMALRSPVVLDPDFSIGRAFGASGTPSAVVIDTDGKIASEVAVGAPAVLALAAG
jgi:peroxiredoxin